MPVFRSVRSPFGLFFWLALLCCLAMVGFGLQDIAQDLRAKRWPRVPCEILRSGIGDSPTSTPGYIATVRYSYQWAGHTYLSDHIRRHAELIHSDVADAEARAARFPQGARLQCYVNPANPREALLEVSPDFMPLVISPFLLFIWALTQRVALADWFERRRQLRRGPAKLPITANRALRRAKAKPLLVGVLSLTLSSVFAGFLWVWPWLQLQASRSWQETPCTVLQAGILTETTHQGAPFYKPEVLYQYDFAGQRHKSSRLDFSAEMSSNYAASHKQAQSYHPGELATCFVNPSQPREAVLLRRFRADPFFSLCTVGFLGMSFFLIVQGLPRQPRRAPANPWEALGPDRPGSAGETLLKPETPPGPRLLLSLLGLVICLASAGWLLSLCWQSWRQGGFDLLPLLYGLGAAVGAFFCAKYAWRSAGEVRHRGPLLKLSPAILTPGHPFTVAWEWPREARNPELRLFLEGVEVVRVLREIATQHGPSRDEKTQEWVFLSLPLTPGEHPQTAAFGQVRGTLPPLTMHSFEGLKTKVQWRIRAEFPGAASARKYPVLVRPPKPSL